MWNRERGNNTVLEKFQNEKLHNMYSSPYYYGEEIKGMRWEG
jgi:hypothetical protein